MNNRKVALHYIWGTTYFNLITPVPRARGAPKAQHDRDGGGGYERKASRDEHLHRDRGKTRGKRLQSREHSGGESAVDNGLNYGRNARYWTGRIE